MQFNFFIRSLKAVAILFSGLCFFSMHAAAQSGEPPVASGPTVKIYFPKMNYIDTVPLVATTAECYQVKVSGFDLWFPKWALRYIANYPGKPAGLDWNERSYQPCAGTAAIPAVARWTAPASVCLNANPAPTSARITYLGAERPTTNKIERILPKCVAFEYGGAPVWTTANEAGGVGCVGNIVQIDIERAFETFRNMRTSTPPAACADAPGTPTPSGPPPVAARPVQPPPVTSTPSAPLPVTNGQVTLQGVHGKYVVAEPNGTAAVNRAAVGPWEKFAMQTHPDGSVSFRSAHGKYIVAESDGRVNANRDAIGPWEKFTVTRNANGTFSFKSAHGKYMVAEPDGRLNANRDAIGPWEGFTLAYPN